MWVIFKVQNMYLHTDRGIERMLLGVAPVDSFVRDYVGTLPGRATEYGGNAAALDNTSPLPPVLGWYINEENVGDWWGYEIQAIYVDEWRPLPPSEGILLGNTTRVGERSVG